ncbi:restriction endonuclease [Sulfurospirillum cavolei]|uniref:restriction endonuclease n=1 Tax=Sulfurospirillum cavolei TaxID=366522 RepID=UPI00076493B5|nr:restriction endonuclease [Sulfurospirillum cavolei]
MAYKYYKGKKEDKRIEAIAYLIILALFFMYYYRETIIKVLSIIIGIAFIIVLLYLLFKPKFIKKSIPEVNNVGVKIIVTDEDHITRRNEKNTTVHEPIKRQSINKETTQNSLHVNEDIQSREKIFFSQISRKNPSYQEKKKRGDAYEMHVGKYYETQGYQIDYHGLKYGKKDGGIDLIAENEHEILLIQCKGWNQTIEMKRRYVVEFMGNCSTFLMDNPHLKEKNIKRIFVTSSEKSELGLDKYLIQHVGKIEYIIMPFS